MKMSRIESFILIILVLNSLRLSAALFANPDLSNPLIPIKWREMCGYRTDKIKFLDNFRSSILYCIVNSTKGRQTFVGSEFQYTSPENRILNGEEVKYRESPWTVQITKRSYKEWYKLDSTYYRHWCTGVLITMQHILTAAHCWNDEIVIRIYAGSDLSNDGWYTDKFKFYQHPNYTTGDKNSHGTKIYDFDYDIGIIVLESPIDWERYGREKDGHELLINTICLPLLEERPIQRKFENATVFGWGRMKSHKFPEILQKGDIMAKYCCRNLKFEYQYVGYPRVCKGDSGSGLVQYLDESRNRAVLIGILSKISLIGAMKDICDEENVGYGSAIRLDVPQIMDWIKEMLKIN